jgi:hypothetical protein
MNRIGLYVVFRDRPPKAADYYFHFADSTRGARLDLHFTAKNLFHINLGLTTPIPLCPPGLASFRSLSKAQDSIIVKACFV